MIKALWYVFGVACIGFLAYSIPENWRNGNDFMFAVDVIGICAWTATLTHLLTHKEDDE